MSKNPLFRSGEENYYCALLWTPAQRSLSEVHYILPIFFNYFLWPPYSPAQVNGGSRNFYTWWTLNVIREVTTWIFSWSSLNYRVSQKVTNLAYFRTPPANFLHSRPNAAEYCNSEKKLVKHRWLLYNVCHVWWTLAYKPQRSTRHKMTRVNSLRYVLFPFARCQHDHARTPYDTVIVCPMLCPNPLTT